MVFLLKYVLGVAVIGTTAVVTPVVATQISIFESSSKTTQQEDVKVECHGVNKNFGLEVDGKVVAWATLSGSLEGENRDKYGNRGKIVDGDKSPCQNTSLYS